ncbi:MAG: DUF2283 domain-containing protein [Anaerolineales bacterium]
MTNKVIILTVWFGNPEDEVASEETGDEVILMKDKNGNVIGNVIGFEKLNYISPASSRLNVAFETLLSRGMRLKPILRNKQICSNRL